MLSTPMRREYTLASLSEEVADPDPIRLFRTWFDQAVEAGVPEPNAMTLATASAEGRPSARVVLLRGHDGRGFTFFTNYESRKGLELEANPHAALVFFWAGLERQVRIEGAVERVSTEESDAYFLTRPPGARIAAWASPQSRVVPDRASLERAEQEFLRRHPEGLIPRPPHWGGYRVVPEALEFWQGRENRLHDRLLYRRDPAGPWIRERLAP